MAERKFSHVVSNPDGKEVISLNNWADMVEAEEAEQSAYQAFVSLYSMQSKENKDSLTLPKDMEQVMPREYKQLKLAAELLKLEVRKSEFVIEPSLKHRDLYSIDDAVREKVITDLQTSGRPELVNVFRKGFMTAMEFLNLFKAFPAVSTSMSKARWYILNKIYTIFGVSRFGITRKLTSLGLAKNPTADDVLEDFRHLFQKEEGARALFAVYDYMTTRFLQQISEKRVEKLKEIFKKIAPYIEASTGSLIQKHSRRVKEKPISKNAEPKIRIQRPFVRDHDLLVTTEEKLAIKKYNAKLKEFFDTIKIPYGNPYERFREVQRIMKELYATSDAFNSILRDRKNAVSILASRKIVEERADTRLATSLIWNKSAHLYMSESKTENQYAELEHIALPVPKGDADFPSWQSEWENRFTGIIENDGVGADQPEEE